MIVLLGPGKKKFELEKLKNNNIGDHKSSKAESVRYVL